MKRVAIYWNTKDREVIARIRKRFGIASGTTVNGESPAEITDEDMPLLLETARRGLIHIRPFRPVLEQILKTRRNV